LRRQVHQRRQALRERSNLDAGSRSLGEAEIETGLGRLHLEAVEGELGVELRARFARPRFFREEAGGERQIHRLDAHRAID